MISPRYASVGFVLVVIALFVWIELTDSGKGIADAVKSDAGSPMGLMTSLPISKRVESLIDESVTTCQGFDGELDVGVLGIQTLRIGNKDELVTVIDEATFNCSAGASIFCGSGGCAVHFLSDQSTLTMHLQGWEKKLSGIRLGLHGAACGQVGSVPCYKELTLLEGSFYVE